MDDCSYNWTKMRNAARIFNDLTKQQQHQQNRILNRLTLRAEGFWLAYTSKFASGAPDRGQYKFKI